MSKIKWVLVYAVLIDMVGGRVAEAAQCHDIRADITRLDDTSSGQVGWQGEVASGLLKGSYLLVVTAFTETPQGLVVGGSASYVGNLVITTNQGTLTASTLGVAVVIPTPPLGAMPHSFAPFAETLPVSGGTGRFAGATGRLFMNGLPSTVSQDGTFVISTEGTVIGQVCVP